MDTPQAFANTGAVPITHMGAYADPAQPIVLIDAATGERQLIWSELDANATSPGETDLLIHPARNLARRPSLHRRAAQPEGLRRQRRSRRRPASGCIATGSRPNIDAGRGAPRPLQGAASGRSKAAGIERAEPLPGLGLHGRRDPQPVRADAVDPRRRPRRSSATPTPGDGIAQGHAPGVTRSPTSPTSRSAAPTDGHGVENIREVTGTYTVPCYLNQPAARPARRYELGARRAPAADPRQHDAGPLHLQHPALRGRRTAAAACRTSTTPARPSMYGHGLFGDYTEVHTGNVRQLGDREQRHHLRHRLDRDVRGRRRPGRRSRRSRTCRSSRR